MKQKQFGYLLPATIMLSLGISIALVSFLQFTASSSETLNTQSYKSIAQEAARAGIAYADSCLSSGSTSWTTPLTPDTTCNGTGPAPSGLDREYVNVHKKGTVIEWRSTFTVEPLSSSDETVVSNGSVELLRNGNKVRTYSSSTVISLVNTYIDHPVSTGESITAIKNDKTDCAIANGKLYCWGYNGSGQVGDNSVTNRTTPTLVQGALAGKTVTKVSVSDSSVCAIADGTPYCWGGNGVDQLGNDVDGNIFIKADVRQPTNNVPLTSSGPLANSAGNSYDNYVTDIGTAAANNPAGLIWPFASALQHSCALTADGSVSCWGYGGFRQLTGGGCIWWTACARFSYPSHATPTLVDGYGDNTGNFAGKKAVRVGVSSHDSCIVANGIMYCWGVPAPLYAGPQVVCSLPLGLFSDADITLVPFNVCVASYSNSYDATNSLFSQMAGKFLDPNTFDVSSNEGCMMADKDFYCFGTTPAFGLFWGSSFRAPWIAIANADVTDADNGDNSFSGGLVGLYCVVDKGTGKCAGSLLNGYTGTGFIGTEQIRPLTATNLLTDAPSTSALSVHQTATKIGAGEDHGCVVANGRLYCWGSQTEGSLANGISSFGNVTVPTLTGTGGSTPIGTGQTETTTIPHDDMQYAAHDSVSVGENHSCGIANGKVVCWGRNNAGQLGLGNNNDADQPRGVPGLVNKASTKVSAGKNHTCAISEGDLYCWGSNASGQLGINGTVDTNIPTLVNGNGNLTTNMRVTDVSASDDNTCAVANAKVYCWGSNSNLQLGRTGSSSTVPLLVNGGTNPLDRKAATSVAVGGSHACAIANADLYCWGNTANGRTGTASSNPTLVNTGVADLPKGPNNVSPSVSAVSAGSDFTCAIINARVACWGSNANGRTGLGTTVGNQPSPAFIGGTAAGYYATSISAGNGHACALIHGNNSAANGNTWCWGNGANGQLGDNALTDNTTPQLISSAGTDVMDTSAPAGYERRVATQIAAGDNSSCAIANAVILCWGNGSYGKLGNGTTAQFPTAKITGSYRFNGSSYIKGPIY